MDSCKCLLIHLFGQKLKTYSNQWYLKLSIIGCKPFEVVISLFFPQGLPYRKHALIGSPWPETQLPRNTSSIKKFENLQALVRLFIFSSLVIANTALLFIYTHHNDGIEPVSFHKKNSF